VAKASEPHFTDDHLRPWSGHCYAVQSYDAYGQRSTRSPRSCAQTLDDKPPTEPRDLKAEARPVNSVTLTWLPSTDDDEVETYEVSRGDKVMATGKTTGLLEPGLAPTKEYCYSVRAIDRAKNRSAAAGPACVVVPDTTAPTIPVNVAAKADGEHAITISWRASTDDVAVARYEMAADGEAPTPVSSGTQTTARRDGLAVATRHCYAVRGCDAAGNCSASSPPVCATTPDLTPPSSPSPSAVAASETEIEVRWGAATDNVGVTGYEVLRGDQVVARTEAGTTLRQPGLQPAKQYCYTVRAHDLAGNTSIPSTTACATTPDLTPPTPPTRPGAVPVSSTQIFVAWDASTDNVGVAGYEVYRGASLVAKVTATRAREYRLQASNKYCYTVRAFDAAGNQSTPAGPFCAVTTTPAELSAPSDLRVRRVSLTNILLQWEPSETKGVLYRVYAQGYGEVGLTAGNTFTPSGRFGAEPNCFRVSALETNDRESPKSNEVCATSAEAAHSAK
jgi:chitodextrinase